MTQGARVGVFGGAFDPPHRAHRALVEAALDQLRLDQLRLLPTGQAWHKPQALTPAVHRIAMARLAFGDLPRVVIDPRETLRAGPSYTIDSLRELQAELPAARWFLILGQDQARDLPTWHQWQQVLALVQVCVAGRPGVQPAPADAEPWRRSLITLEMPPMDLSATDIRARCARGEPVDALVGEPVARYIALHQLYPPT